MFNLSTLKAKNNVTSQFKMVEISNLQGELETEMHI